MSETTTTKEKPRGKPRRRPDSVLVARVEFEPTFSAKGKVPIHTGGIQSHRVTREGRKSPYEIEFLPAISHIRITSTNPERPGSLMVPTAGNVRHWEPL